MHFVLKSIVNILINNTMATYLYLFLYDFSTSLVALDRYTHGIVDSLLNAEKERYPLNHLRKEIISLKV